MRYVVVVFAALLLAGTAQAQAPDWQRPLDAKFAGGATSLSVLIQLHTPAITDTPERATTSDQARSIASAATTPFVRALQSSGIAVRSAYTYQPIVLADIRPDDLRALAERPEIAAVYENYYISLDPIPTEPAPNLPTTLPDRERPQLDKSTKYVNADAAWARGYRGQGYAVAVLDSGINAGHEMFRGRLVAEACFSDPTIVSYYESLCPNQQKSAIGPGTAALCPGGKANTSGVCEHGSHVAGIALGDNNAATDRLRGVAPEANLVAVQVFTRTKGCDSCLGAYTSDLLAAMDWVASVAATYKIAAVNMSLGSSGGYSSGCTGMALENSIKMLRQMNVLTVIAAGNGGYRNALSHPGCIRDAFTVGSINLAAMPSYFTNSATGLDLFAPGELVRSATFGSATSYTALSGTSMATPHVAGAVAVLRSKLPTATAAQLEYALQISGPKVTRSDWTWSTPRLDLNAALDVLGLDPPPPGVTMVGLFPGDRPDVRSILRLTNPGTSGFVVPVTVIQDTPRVVLGTYKITLPGNGTMQASVRDMENAIRAQALATSLVSLSINPPREVYAQHITVDSNGQALSNLTLCTSDKIAPSTMMTFVHTQNVVGRVSYITMTNTSPLPATPMFYLYNGGNGNAPAFTLLGSTRGPTIEGNSTVRFAAQTILDKERVPGLPMVPSSISYVDVSVSNFTGLIRHDVEQSQIRTVTDMTTKCAI